MNLSLHKPVALARTAGARLYPDQRLALLILALLLVRLGLFAWIAGGLPALPAALCRWDCSWYRDTASLGYANHPKIVSDATYGQANWAFFPVFPLLMRGVAQVLGVSYAAAGSAVSNLCLGLFVFVSTKYLRLAGPAAAAMAAFLVAVPPSFYMSLPYTEAVYAALLMAALWCLQAGRPTSASLFAALLSATRVTGVLLAPVILCRYLVPFWHAARRRDWRQAAGIFRAALLPVALAPAGLFAYMLYLYLHTGDGLAFLHIQRAWGRVAEMPWRTLVGGLYANDLTTFQPHDEESATLNALAAVAGLALAGRLFWLRRCAESWLLATAILIPATHGLESLPRYSLAQPLFLVFLFEAIWTSRLRAIFWEIVAVCAVAQLWMAQLWMQNYAFIH